MPDGRALTYLRIARNAADKASNILTDPYDKHAATLVWKQLCELIDQVEGRDD